MDPQNGFKLLQQQRLFYLFCYPRVSTCIYIHHMRDDYILNTVLSGMCPYSSLYIPEYVTNLQNMVQHRLASKIKHEGILTD